MLIGHIVVGLQFTMIIVFCSSCCYVNTDDEGGDVSKLADVPVAKRKVVRRPQPKLDSHRYLTLQYSVFAHGHVLSQLLE